MTLIINLLLALFTTVSWEPKQRRPICWRTEQIFLILFLSGDKFFHFSLYSALIIFKKWNKKKTDFLPSYLLWHQVLMFTQNSFPAYNWGISFGRQCTMPTSNQAEFPQQHSSLRKVILQKGEKKKVISWL